jgi:hypothetical protein
VASAMIDDSSTLPVRIDKKGETAAAGVSTVARLSEIPEEDIRASQRRRDLVSRQITVIDPIGDETSLLLIRQIP